jgi:hypothetical protein
MSLPIRFISYGYIVLIALIVCAASASSSGGAASSKTVPMYYFWQVACSHCEELKPFMAELEAKYPQLDLKLFEVSKSQEGSDLFDEMARAYGRKAKVTPTVFVGDYMIEGYNGWITEGRIESALINCTEKKCVTPEEKMALYRSGGAASSTTAPAASTTTTAVTTSSTTTTRATSTTTSTNPTTTTTTTTTSSTTSILLTEEKEANPVLLYASIAAAAVVFALLVLRIRKKRG